MARHEFFTVDVFTEQRFGGNPLAVFPQAAGLDDRQMQQLAREFNLSETTFVFPPVDPAHTAHVRIFTPGSELPFAGHPNVGTAFVLARRRTDPVARLIFEEKAGLVPMEIEQDGAGRPVGATLTAPQPLELGRELPAAVIAACVGLKTEEVAAADRPPVLAGVGVEFILAELVSADALRRAEPDLAAFRNAARQFPEIAHRFQIHLYVRDPANPARVATRMFGPLLGIPEDPATGSANAALAAFLGRDRVAAAPGGVATFEITQGVEMGRPSRMTATARRAADGSLRATIGGRCVPVLHGHVEL